MSTRPGLSSNTKPEELGLTTKSIKRGRLPSLLQGRGREGRHQASMIKQQAKAWRPSSFQFGITSQNVLLPKVKIIYSLRGRFMNYSEACSSYYTVWKEILKLWAKAACVG